MYTIYMLLKLNRSDKASVFNIINFSFILLYIFPIRKMQISQFEIQNIHVYKFIEKFYNNIVFENLFLNHIYLN